MMSGRHSVNTINMSTDPGSDAAYFYELRVDFGTRHLRDLNGAESLAGVYPGAHISRGQSPTAR